MNQLLILCATLACSLAKSPVYYQPDQVHIAFGEEPGQMLVVWNTLNNTQVPTVRFSPLASSNWTSIYGNTRKFTNIGPSFRVEYIHRVRLTGLSPGKKYEYMCGSVMGWSSLFTFTAMKSGWDWSPRFALYGDMGNVNAQSVPRLQREAMQGMYDAVLHVGDFAYDLDVAEGRVGDEFMRQIEPIASKVPYMTCPGNHEQAYNFTNYKNRFVMPGDELGDKMFYSFNIGPAHIISFNTEYYFFTDYGIMQAVEQYRWLEKDLQEASSAANRAKRPWIITMAHRPMYCSNTDKDDCTKYESIVRTGWKWKLPFFNPLALEPLFYKYGVDLQLWAHEHSYERLWPVYNRTVYNGSRAEPYTNPGAPVHIVTGSAGCQERIDPFVKNPSAWSALRISDYGYTRMTISNSTHLYLEQVSDDQNGKIMDSIWLKKDHHGPYHPKQRPVPRPDILEPANRNKGYQTFFVRRN